MGRQRQRRRRQGAAAGAAGAAEGGGAAAAPRPPPPPAPPAAPWPPPSPLSAHSFTDGLALGAAAALAPGRVWPAPCSSRSRLHRAPAAVGLAAAPAAARRRAPRRARARRRVRPLAALVREASWAGWGLSFASGAGAAEGGGAGWTRGRLGRCWRSRGLRFCKFRLCYYIYRCQKYWID